jgi:hypothetical protein
MVKKLNIGSFCPQDLLLLNLGQLSSTKKCIFSPEAVRICPDMSRLRVSEKQRQK